jgi:putative copper resistance protein D
LIDILLIIARLFHFGSCLLLVGLAVFDRLAAPDMDRATGEFAARWNGVIGCVFAVAWIVCFVSGALWLLCVAATMSGEGLSKSLAGPVVSTVWKQTQFGLVWKWRLAGWCLAGVSIGRLLLRKPMPSIHAALSWCLLGACAALAGSLAWAGHGLTGSRWHLFADVLHLVAAGCWPMTLLPFAILLALSASLPAAARMRLRARVAWRFSLLSLTAVAALTCTGIVNGFVLIGSFSDLSSTAYGRWLLAKVFLFLLMVGLGALNLAKWRPRLTDHGRGAAPSDHAEKIIFRNVQIEAVLAAAIFLIIAILGILPPPNAPR